MFLQNNDMGEDIVYNLLIPLEAEKQLAEAQLAKLRVELAKAQTRAAFAEAALAAKHNAKEAELRELITALCTELAHARQPWWRKLASYGRENIFSWLKRPKSLRHKLDLEARPCLSAEGISGP